ncbi:phosphatase PAP2 family protein [Cellulomonas chengniuliangii]|uniref:phosphatase PAP2 family protein n=1 Tax=Cellulomonas chengniuliangii TaxID=2968084 RepID=UPI001D0E10DD|nr:phosphatase PAP2 family protein [Cellulomonas chengniuliangii]MCC2318045.1 phosphatase PAP2 family protein [Cellulomonas chengniuliangii]
MTNASTTRALPRAERGAPSRLAGATGLVVAVVSAVGVWACWRLFVDTWAGQQVEWAALQGAQNWQGQLWRVAERVLDVVSVGFIAVVLLAAVLIALVRRRWSLAVQVAVLMIGANVTTRVVKLVLLDRPDLGVEGTWGNTLPSGHTTAAASISAVLLMVVPRRIRPWAAVLGAGYTAATGVSTLVGQWHRPSDVVAAVLVVTAWAAVSCSVVALLPSTRDLSAPAVAPGSREQRSTRRVTWALVIVGLASGAVALVALQTTWAHRVALDSRADVLTAYLGGAAGVLAASCLAFALLLALMGASTAPARAAAPSESALDETS